MESPALTSAVHVVALGAPPPKDAVLDGSGIDVGRASAFYPMRASEPITMDDLINTTAQQQQQLHLQQQQQRLRQRQQQRRFPLSDAQLPPVTLSEERKERMRALGDEMIARAERKSQAAWDGTKQIFDDDDPKQWKLHYAKPNLSLYRKRESKNYGSGHSNTGRRFVATGRVPCLSLKDVEYGLYRDTTLDERAVSAYIFQEHFLDAAVLEVFETQTESDPFHYFGINWLAMMSSGGSKFLSARDYACFEYAKTITNERGERILVKVVHSVGKDVVPPTADLGSPDNVHLVRGMLSITYMYRYDKRSNSVQVFAEGYTDPCGSAPSWLGSAYLTHFAPSIINIDHCADVKYIMKHGLVFPHAASSRESESTMSKSQSNSNSSLTPSVMHAAEQASMLDMRASWVPDHQRKVCFVCFKSFNIMRRHRHHCRMCGEVMCSRCMLTLPLVAPVTSSNANNSNNNNNNAAHKTQQPHVPPKNDEAKYNPAVCAMKFCKKCVFTIRQERKGAMYGVANFYNFASAMIRPFAPNGADVAYGPGNNQLIHEQFGEDGEQDDDEDEDESDEAYSARIERLRQQHMEQEKRKNNTRRSIRLLDDEASALASTLTSTTETSGPASSCSATPKSSENSFNFDHLLALASSPDVEEKKNPFYASMPLPRQQEKKIALIPDEDARRIRSMSIPEKQQSNVGRSTADQESLIRTIELQRAKLDDISSSIQQAAQIQQKQALPDQPRASSAQSTAMSTGSN